MTPLDLRPLSLGELLDRTFFLYRRNFLLFTGISAIPYSFFFVANLGSTLLTRFRFGGPGFPGQGQIPSASSTMAIFGTGLDAFMAIILVSFLAHLFSVAASVFAISEIYMGRPTSIRASLRRAAGRALTVFGVLFLSGLIVGVGLLLLVVPGIYLACRISAATAAALLEDTGAAEGIRRSFELTKNFAGRAFMIYVLSVAMAWGVVAVFQVPFIMLIALYAKQPQVVTIWMVFMQVGNFLGTVLVAPVSAIGFALYYYDLRVRKEGLDLQMMMQSIASSPVAGAISGGLPSTLGPDAS